MTTVFVLILRSVYIVTSHGDFLFFLCILTIYDARADERGNVNIILDYYYHYILWLERKTEEEATFNTSSSCNYLMNDNMMLKKRHNTDIQECLYEA
jgi:hypothetical protein